MTENSRIQLWKKLNKIQKPTDRQFNKLRNLVHEQNEYFTKDSETLEKNQIEILEMKNSIKDIKNELASIENRADQMGERIRDIKDRNLEITQRGKETLEQKKNMKELCKI